MTSEKWNAMRRACPNWRLSSSVFETTKENHNKPHNIACLGGHVRLSPRGMKSEAPLAHTVVRKSNSNSRSLRIRRWRASRFRQFWDMTRCRLVDTYRYFEVRWWSGSISFHLPNYTTSYRNNPKNWTFSVHPWYQILPKSFRSLSTFELRATRTQHEPSDRNAVQY